MTTDDVTPVRQQYLDTKRQYQANASIRIASCFSAWAIFMKPLMKMPKLFHANSILS
jgi:hypothetical protein